jgi:undecaprenol kinase
LPTSGRRHDLGAAFGYAFAGLVAAWRSEPNLRIHAGIAAAVVVAGAVLRLPPLAWALVFVAIALVVAAELLNAALEAVVDLVSPEDHPLAKRAKDVAAAGVLIAAAGAVAVGVCLAVWAAGRG